ncbi:MAG: CBS domain-containing protein, partial [Gammaproteobacteria bacterium]|nr:CBS domain-containing protein [Gammaproteobacteria bacterium]
SKLYNDFWMEDQGFIEREHYDDLRDLIGRLHEQAATVTVGPDDTLTTAHNRLRNAGFSQLPVMESGELVGVLTEEDIMRVAFGSPERLRDNVRGAMQTAFPSVEKDFGTKNLVALLSGVPYTAVIDDGQFLGLITRSDVLNYLRKQMPPEPGPARQSK